MYKCISILYKKEKKRCQSKSRKRNLLPLGQHFDRLFIAPPHLIAHLLPALFKNYRVLMYTGNFDLICGFTGTEYILWHVYCFHAGVFCFVSSQRTVGTQGFIKNSSLPFYFIYGI